MNRLLAAIPGGGTSAVIGTCVLLLCATLCVVWRERSRRKTLEMLTKFMVPGQSIVQRRRKHGTFEVRSEQVLTPASLNDRRQS